MRLKAKQKRKGVNRVETKATARLILQAGVSNQFVDVNGPPTLYIRRKTPFYGSFSIHTCKRHALIKGVQLALTKPRLLYGMVYRPFCIPLKSKEHVRVTKCMVQPLSIFELQLLFEVEVFETFH